MRTILLYAALPVALVVGYGVAAVPSAADAAPAKNVQIYPKGTDTKALKEDMKKIGKALGVQCDYCHDMSAMDKDTDLKKKARAMMKMTMSFNTQAKAAKFTQVVSCNTCHLGQKKPKPDVK